MCLLVRPDAMPGSDCADLLRRRVGRPGAVLWHPLLRGQSLAGRWTRTAPGDTGSMDSVEQILEWADHHVERLRADMVLRQGMGVTYWQVEDSLNRGKIRGRVAAGLEFLERFTGVNSRWAGAAHDVFESHDEQRSMESGARAIGDVIAEWASLVRSGQLKPRLVESMGVRALASTDLLEQVRVLNADASVSPAAPIVLAGAALEMALRSAVEQLGLEIKEKPGISAYARALRTADVFNKQDIKDIEQAAGVRNQAAHGEHEALSRERAGSMEQLVNLILRRLEDAMAQIG